VNVQGLPVREPDLDTNKDGSITTDRPANRFNFRNQNGGRYDASDLFNLHPQMAEDYRHDKFEVLKPGR
jgi:hypothetical protein